ncbi:MULTISPECIES: hypothetical protein [unclassified Halomonas]|uniref:hypothetical protein n=1 Tax=unclassified Halomonas TaxID=2609666 RepID=UPI0009908F83|nr:MULTISPECIES: hypothetical protein [unclassified Halomonas]AQU84906.1 hypothetical protein B2G49_21350 [Halomonas sp. 'Soap Lake \
MLVDKLDSFFCELKPTLVTQQYAVKSPCSFFLKSNGERSFQINGFATSGLEKSGEVEQQDNDVGEGTIHLKGSFVESGKTVFVDFKASFLDIDVIFGAGTWEEKVGNSIRQKYSVIIRGSEFLAGEKGFVDNLFESYSQLEEKYQTLKDKVDDVEAEVDDLESKAEEYGTSTQEFLEQEKELMLALEKTDGLTEQLSSGLEEVNKLTAELERIGKKQDEQLKKSSSLNERANSVIEKSDEVKNRADKALSSSITVSLAKTFKDRKKEAIHQRWLYDVVFVISISIGILMTYNMLDQILPSGEGATYNFEALIIRMPFLMFFVWLGLFASKKSSHASRIEEFYAQKQTLAESYEGYKGEIARMSDNTSELEKLMAINLVSISQDSSQIFDGVRKEKHLPLEIFTERLLDKFSLKKKDDPKGEVENHHKTDE